MGSVVELKREMSKEEICNLLRQNAIKLDVLKTRLDTDLKEFNRIGEHTQYLLDLLDKINQVE